MAIVKSKDGRYFDIPDKLLKKHAVDSRKLPVARSGASAPGGVQIIIEEAGGGEVGGRMVYGGADMSSDRHRCEAPRMGDSTEASRSRCCCCGVRG